ncbi:Vancomycin resistance protein YoaR, contains peptidoglycan-binding and VanW domains [Psychrobacillus sp. OK028]|uniref:VanW family protein n=1 Tax=Psychrobacillus sp. OK028 TaxID=1884359 RepID=UPI000889568E|nr:VanW family protein [Psychrobacillus sp. OK028]SDM79888.1 Vancomycin resistance protein YoaR, contains peptidoglycan-binding and VanW domains [Psychrobacillus sp. OK028]
MKIIWKSVVLALLTYLLVYLWTNNFNPLQQQVSAESEDSGSSIGGQQVESLDREEIISLLDSKILEWKQNPILLTGNNTDITLNPEWFLFDVEASVEQFENQTSTSWFSFWESEPTVHLPLQVVMSPELTTLIEANGHLDTEATLEVIKNQVAMLSSEPIVSVALDLSLFQTERIAFDIETITINTNSLNDIISALNDQIIGNGEMFSVNEHIEGINLGNSDETINFVASLMYSAVLQTNFEVVERHSQGSIPNYLQPGIEAKISKTKDLKFVNTNNSPASIKISIKGSELIVEIYSVPSETVAEYQVSENEITPRTIYRYSSKLKPNEEELIQEGEPGLRVLVYRTISDKAGPYEKEDLVSQDYYPPVNRIVLKSSVVPETAITQNPDLEVDLNGDGFADINTNPSTITNTNQTQDSEKEQSNNPPNTTSPASGEEDSDGLPEGSYYDKAGNIIDGSK